MSPAAGDGQVRAGRLVREGDARVEPLYPAARLLKGNILEVTQCVADARRELEEARAEAKRLCEEAHREVESLREQVRREASQRAVEDFTALLGAARGAVADFEQSVQSRAERLVLHFARAILESEVTVRPELMHRLVRSVLDRAKAYSQIAVVLHPDDLARVREAGNELLDALPFAEQIQFREDATLARHGCRIETEMGTFDGSLELQLQRLAAQMSDVGEDASRAEVK